MLAEVWNAEGVEALLSLMARTRVVREHELVQELHEQSIECQRTAPEVSAQLHRVAGQLTELHAGLRAAESIRELEDLLRWQAEAPWRMSEAMHGLLAAVAADRAGAEQWPWRLEALPPLRAQLDRLLAVAGELLELPDEERHRRVDGEPGLHSSQLLVWLRAMVARGGDDAPRMQRLAEHIQAWQRMGPASEVEPVHRLEEAVLAELVALWHRLDPVLDRTCGALGAEIVTGQRPLVDALRTIVVDAESTDRAVHRRTVLLHHLLDEPMVSVRRAALVAYSRQVMSPDAQAFDRLARAALVQRWAAALELHWRVLPDPPTALEPALRVVDQTLPSVLDGTAPALARGLMFARARLLRCLASWREGMLEEALRAYRMALDAPSDSSEPIVRGRALGELAGLRRARREPRVTVQDREIRSTYDEALECLKDSVLVRARVLSDYAVYLARPLRPGAEDAAQAQALSKQAVALLEGLPDAVREHPLVRGDEAQHLVTRGNLRLEVGVDRPQERRDAAVADYRSALDRLGEGEDLLRGLVHLDLACVALALAPRGQRDEQIERAREELGEAVEGLVPMPVPHARAVAELAMLEVRAAPEDDAVRDRSIRAVEAALHRLPVGSERVVRGRVERQLGELYLNRDGADDLARGAERFAAARSAFAEGGAARLAVEAARDYAETQLRQYADAGDAAVLTRGAVVLEQAALVAERRWATRRPGEPQQELSAMLDGVYGDLAWFQARLGRPVEQLLRTVTRAKRYRSTPSLRTLRVRTERSSMLSPAYFDPFARRLPPTPPSISSRANRGPSAAELRTQVEAFVAAEPEALVLDLTLTRWGTVVVAADATGLTYGTLSLTRDTVRRWVWGQTVAPGWWSCYLGYCRARERGDEATAAEREKAWRAAGTVLARELGRRLFEPLGTSIGRSLDGRLVIVAAGRLSGLPLAAARVGEQVVLAQRVKGLAQIASVADLPAGPLAVPRPSRALCVLADPEASDGGDRVEELRDVVRLLASARADVEVLAQLGETKGEAVYRPTQAKTKERTTVGDETPAVEAVSRRVGAIDHLFYGGLGHERGLMLVSPSGSVESLDGEALGRAGTWGEGSSVFLSAATRQPPSLDDGAQWNLLHALGEAGVGYVVMAGCSVPMDMARDFSRGFYLYWALGRSIPVAYCAALANVAGADPSRVGAFMVWLGGRERSGVG